MPATAVPPPRVQTLMRHRRRPEEVTVVTDGWSDVSYEVLCGVAAALAALEQGEGREIVDLTRFRKSVVRLVEGLDT